MKNSGFRLWCYIAKNADSYNFALSKAAAQRDFGVTKNQYFSGFEELVKKGYLVPTKEDPDLYDFYEDGSQIIDMPSTEDATCDENRYIPEFDTPYTGIQYRYVPKTGTEIKQGDKQYKQYTEPQDEPNGEFSTMERLGMRGNLYPLNQHETNGTSDNNANNLIQIGELTFTPEELEKLAKEDPFN